MTSRRNGNGTNGNGANGRSHNGKRGNGKHLKDKPQSASPHAVSDEDLRTMAIKYRIAGESYRSIARLMNAELVVLNDTGNEGKPRTIEKSKAHALVIEGLKENREQNAEKIEEVRAIEVERLDHWLARLNARKDHADPRVVSTMLSISKRRSELLGLDAETQSKIKLVGAGDGPIEFAIHDPVAVFNDRLAKLREQIKQQGTATIAAPVALPAKT